MRWHEITARVSEQAVDLVANILIEEGCGGAAITGPSVRVTGYLPVDGRLDGRIATIRARIELLPETDLDIGPGEITVTHVDESDWAEGWRSYFAPVEIGKILVRPSWEREEGVGGRTPSGVANSGRSVARIVVEIDPGMAFGTGHHATTKLCLLALQKHVRGGERVMDVGTGSGILAIAAAKLGAAEVVATEMDPVAVEAARENVRRNGVEDRVRIVQSQCPAAGRARLRPSQSAARTEPRPPVAADVVIANITADAIVGLAPELAAATAMGGTLIVSGLVEDRAEEVARRLMQLGFRVIERTSEEGWVAIEMRSACLHKDALEV